MLAVTLNYTLKDEGTSYFMPLLLSYHVSRICYKILIKRAFFSSNTAVQLTRWEALIYCIQNAEHWIVINGSDWMSISKMSLFKGWYVDTMP